MAVFTDFSSASDAVKG